MRTAVYLLLACCACGHRAAQPRPVDNCGPAPADWGQWARGPAHSGTACPPAQQLDHAITQLEIDPFVASERAESGGDLLVHYQTPLLVGNDVYVELKSGRYTPCVPPGSGTPAGCGVDSWSDQRWLERKLHWAGGLPNPAWSFQTDWTPPRDGGHLRGWEPVFHAAATERTVYVPGAGGSLFALDAASGALAGRADPFQHDPLAYVAGPPALDATGDVFYPVIRFDDAAQPWSAGARGALVKISPDGGAQIAWFDNLVPGAPAAGDLCELDYPIDADQPLPLEDAQGKPLPPPTAPCGAQRPQLNSTPAIAADGTVYVVSRAHGNDRHGYLLAFAPSLQLKWAASLRGLLQDGCGVTVPADDQPLHCRANAPAGIDPFTGGAPAAAVGDESTASPVALPDGRVLYGAYTRYNGERGHTLLFDADGAFLRSYDFGWDTTPAFFEHDGTYSIVLKDNHYESKGPFFLTQLDARLQVEWQFAAPGDASRPGGYEWCVNAVAIDGNGTVYGGSEDGNLYAVDQGGRLRARFLLGPGLGAAYTPMSIDGAGRVYVQNAGRLFIVGAQ